MCQAELKSGAQFLSYLQKKTIFTQLSRNCELRFLPIFMDEVFVGSEHLNKITISRKISSNFLKKIGRRHSKTITELPREVEISI